MAWREIVESSSSYGAEQSKPSELNFNIFNPPPLYDLSSSSKSITEEPSSASRAGSSMNLKPPKKPASRKPVVSKPTSPVLQREVVEPLIQESKEEPQQTEPTKAESPLDVYDKIRNSPAEDSSEPGIPTQPRIGRYNFNIEHGWVMPHWTNEWAKLAQTENSASAPGGGAGGLGGAFSSTAKQRELNRKHSDWIKFQNEIKAGTFSNGEGIIDLEQVIPQATRMIDSYRRAGGDPDELFVMGDNLGGFKAKASANTQKVLNRIADTEDILGHIQTAVKDNKWNSPSMRSMIDKDSDLITKLYTESGATISDAEKVRNQFLTQPEEALKQFDKIYAEYNKFLDSVEQAGGVTEFTNKKRGVLNELRNVAYGAGSNKRGDAAGAVVGAAELWKDDASFMPSNPPVALEAANAKWKEFKENVIRQAMVDPRNLWILTNALRKREIAKYRTLVRELGGIPRNFDEYATEDSTVFSWTPRKEDVKYADVRFNPIPLQRDYRGKSANTTTGNSRSRVRQ